MEVKESFDDQRVEQVMGNLLRAGVMLAAAIVLAGGIVYLVRHWTEPAETHQAFDGDPREFISPSGIIGAAFHGSGRGIIQLGLLVLIATPVARVIFSVIAFLIQRDRTYVVLTLLVLTVLIYSLCSGYLEP